MESVLLLLLVPSHFASLARLVVWLDAPPSPYPLCLNAIVDWSSSSLAGSKVVKKNAFKIDSTMTARLYLLTDLAQTILRPVSCDVGT
jgi:hypothetical protein